MTHILGPDAIEWQGVQYKTILTTDATNGAKSITNSVSQPGSGPPRHVHQDADETFIVLSGENKFWLDGEVFTCGPGETAFVRRGKDHTFQVIGDMPSRHLVILTPGGFEGSFAEMAKGQFRIPDDMEIINTIASRYHLSFTGPPLGAEQSNKNGETK